MLLKITWVTANQRCRHLHEMYKGGFWLACGRRHKFGLLFLKGRTRLWTLKMTRMTMLIFPPRISIFMGTLLLNNISPRSPFGAPLPITCLNYTLSLLIAVLCLIYCTVHDGCLPNKFFITFNVIICIAASLISFHSKIQVGSILLSKRL